MIRLLYSYNSLRVIDCRCCSTELSYITNSRCCCAVFYSQLTSKVIHARSVQAVVYLERHVVSFEYSVSLIVRNNRLYIIFVLMSADVLLKLVIVLSEMRIASLCS